MTTIEEDTSHVTIVAKLKDNIDAEEAICEMKEKFPIWNIEWFSNQTYTPSHPSDHGHPPPLNSPPNSGYYFLPNQNCLFQHPYWMSISMAMRNAAATSPLSSQGMSRMSNEDIYLAMERLSMSPPPQMVAPPPPNRSPPGFEPEIFVGRLNPAHASTENLREKYSKYGEIESIQVINRPQGKEW